MHVVDRDDLLVRAVAGRDALRQPVPIEGRGARPGDGAARARGRRLAAADRMRPRLHVRHRRLSDQFPDQPRRRRAARARLPGDRRHALVPRRHRADLPVPTVYPGAPEPTNFDEPGAGSVALVALFRHGSRPRVEAEPVAFWRWIDVTCRDIHELRTLLTTPDLERHVVRLHAGYAGVAGRRRTRSSASCAISRAPTPRTGAPASCWSTAPTFGCSRVPTASSRTISRRSSRTPSPASIAIVEAPKTKRRRRGRRGRWRTCTSCCRATRRCRDAADENPSTARDRTSPASARPTSSSVPA